MDIIRLKMKQSQSKTNRPVLHSYFRNSYSRITSRLLISLLFVSIFNIQQAQAQGKSNTNPSLPLLHTVVIDAGHGGHDPGCVGKITQEKHIALAIALELQRLINRQYPEVRVVLTRDRDVFVPLHERAAIANRHQASLFISIHCNAMPGSSATYGSETFVMGLHTAEHNLNVAKRENDAILLEANYERNYDYNPNSPEGHIMLSMFQHAYMDQSIRFAEKIERHFTHTARRRSRGVKQAGFVVLKETTMPSVLIEAGFLTNQAEEQFLSTPAGQQQIAQSILGAFREYKTDLERTNRSLLVDTPTPGNPEPPLSPTPTREIHFGVQLAATSRPLPAERYAGINGVELFEENRLYKYQVRYIPSLEQAQVMRNEIRNRGFTDAFILAFRNTQRINIEEAKQLSQGQQ